MVLCIPTTVGGLGGQRSESFKRLRTSYGLWLDTDDVIGVKHGNEDKEITARAAYDAFQNIIKKSPEYDLFFFDYVYSRDEYGNKDVVHARERLLKNPLHWQWIWPIHESLVPNKKPLYTGIKDIEIIHLPGEKEEPSTDRNMRMLRDWYEQLKTVNIRHDLCRCRLQIGQALWGQQKYHESSIWLEEEFLW